MLNIERVCIKNPSIKNYLNKPQSESYPDIVYIGRKFKVFGYIELPGNPLANPYVIGKDGTREDVVQKYKEWLWKQVQNNAEVKEELNNLLKNIRFKNTFPLKLACWCKSNERCHGDVIIDCLNWMEINHIGEE